jgi:hypothetical protein
MTHTETLRLALEALETSMYPQQKQLQAITAIKAALEAKDEPVAWIKRSAKGNIYDLLSEPDDGYEPVYTTPPQRTWVGLTDEEVTWLCNTAKSHEQTWGMFVRAIETKLRSKNDSHR